MNSEDYLAALDAKLRALADIVSVSNIHRETDSNLGIGLVRGSIVFVDGSRFDFVEQLPITRNKYRLNYMALTNRLIARWDSAPHHKKLKTFPFHKHTPQNVQEHQATTTLAVLDEIATMVKV